LVGRPVPRSLRPAPPLRARARGSRSGLGGLRSSYRRGASFFGNGLSHNSWTTQRRFQSSRAPATRTANCTVSPTCSRRWGLAISSLTRTRPSVQARVAWLRVLKALAICSHLSRRTSTLLPPLPLT
jgi:hypothetical protein